MPINDGDFLRREEVIQEVLSQMAISSSPEAMRARLLNLQGVNLNVPDINVGKWISVSERLPEEWKDVLVLNAIGCASVAVYLGDCGKSHIPWRVSWNHDFLEAPVTHWMPLFLVPPKEE
jgi:hypothetical protein